MLSMSSSAHKWGTIGSTPALQRIESSAEFALYKTWHPVGDTSIAYSVPASPSTSQNSTDNQIVCAVLHQADATTQLHVIVLQYFASTSTHFCRAQKAHINHDHKSKVPNETYPDA